MPTESIKKKYFFQWVKYLLEFLKEMEVVKIFAGL